MNAKRIIQNRIQIIEKQLQQPLPGIEAQKKMAHAVRLHVVPPPPDVKIACVMLMLYQKNNELHFPLIERVTTKNVNDRHSGQISFPGGRLEELDNSLEEGALRETEEEIGVAAPKIKILGSLTELYIPVSNYLVHPFIGYLDETPQFQAQESEVKKILEAPLGLLLNPETRQKTRLRLSNNMILNDVPFYNIFGHVVWGATAMMLSEFVVLTNPLMANYKSCND